MEGALCQQTEEWLWWNTADLHCLVTKAELYVLACECACVEDEDHFREGSWKHQCWWVMLHESVCLLAGRCGR